METGEINLQVMLIIAIASLVLPWSLLKLVLGRSFLETAHVFVFWTIVWVGGVLGFHTQGTSPDGFAAGMILGAYFAIPFIILFGGEMLRPYSVATEVVVGNLDPDANDGGSTKSNKSLRKHLGNLAPNPSAHVSRDAARAIEEQRAQHHNQGSFR